MQSSEGVVGRGDRVQGGVAGRGHNQGKMHGYKEAPLVTLSRKQKPGSKPEDRMFQKGRAVQ